MKNSLLIVLLFNLVMSLYAQVPSYYDDINLSLSGQSLRSELGTKVTTTQTTVLSYTPGVWEALQQADLNPQNGSDVLLIYGYNDADGVLKTDRTRGAADNGGAANEWNREHVFPRSLGNPNLGSTGPGSDAHHLRPADPEMNSSRSNRRFAAGSGNAAVTAQGYFYPGDEWKGDVARMMLFMYIRYENRCLPSAVGVGNPVAGDSNMIDLFLQWNVEDPVNGYEDNRNDVIEGIQGNRNPFIDNPAFATQIWGGPQAEDRFGDNQGGGSSVADLFFSEYVEGSSFNKVVEVANFTGSSINLSQYSIRRQGNGVGSWSSGYALSGALSSGAVYVIANNQASSSARANADAITSNTALSFNGNDPVGLFKNGVLIDIIGTFDGGSANFAKDVTLRRKPTVSGGTTSFSLVEWDSFAQNTFSDLGTHTISGRTAAPLDYCDAQSANASFEFIDFVGLGGISNTTTSDGGYGDFTNQTGTVRYGANTITLSVGFSGQAYTETWGVWIDFNQNGTFENSEKVVAASTSSTANSTYNFTIPTNALSGNTQMRVAMKWDGTPTACETFSYGEVEDYTVSIAAGRASMPIEQASRQAGELAVEGKRFDISISEYNDSIIFSLVDDRAVTYSVHNMLGQQVASGSFERETSLYSLNAGIYIVQIFDGQRSLRRKFVKS